MTLLKPFLILFQTPNDMKNNDFISFLFMLYNNAQYKNETMDQGSVIEYYKKLKDIISTNDGTRSS